MISVKQFIEKLRTRHFLCSSDALKKQATQLRKMSGSISKFGFNDFDLSLSEKKTLADVVELLNKAATISAKASQTRKKMEEEMSAREKVSFEMVVKSPFGALETVVDKVCLIAMVQSYSLDGAGKRLWSAQYCMNDSFKECLRVISYSVAKDIGRESETIDSAWQRYNERKPEMMRKYAHLILQIEELLSVDKATVNRV